MDEPDCDPAELDQSLAQIAFLNRFVGAYSAIKARLLPALDLISEDTISILDVGTGIGDIPVKIIEWSRTRQLKPTIVATDIKADIVETARAYAGENLTSLESESIRYSVADIFDLPYADDSFDVVLANQVLHHFSDTQIPQILTELDRVSRYGVFIEDLHRHRIAYTFIRLTSFCLRMTKMVQNDGPVSVSKGFKKAELHSYFELAGLPKPVVRWHVTFRWTVSTVTDKSDSKLLGKVQDKASQNQPERFVSP